MFCQIINSSYWTLVCICIQIVRLTVLSLFATSNLLKAQCWFLLPFSHDATFCWLHRDLMAVWNTILGNQERKNALVVNRKHHFVFWRFQDYKDWKFIFRKLNSLRFYVQLTILKGKIHIVLLDILEGSPRFLAVRKPFSCVSLLLSKRLFK